jgi:protein ImuA
MRIVPALTRPGAAATLLRCWASGVAGLDAALGGGLAYGRVHEIYAADAGDGAAAAGFAMAAATGMAGGDGTILWLRTRRAAALGGAAQGDGWADLGGQPGHGLISIVPDALALLRTAVDGVRCGAIGAVIAEEQGAMREWDLTASRRLALAAEKSGVPLFLLRIDAAPVPSATHTRWQVAAAPSHPLPGNAPGLPTFAISLLRQRSGPGGLDWQLEWDRDQCLFRDAALSGAVAPLPARRPAADVRSGAAPNTRSIPRRAA